MDFLSLGFQIVGVQTGGSRGLDSRKRIIFSNGQSGQHSNKGVTGGWKSIDLLSFFCEIHHLAWGGRRQRSKIMHNGERGEAWET